MHLLYINGRNRDCVCPASGFPGGGRYWCYLGFCSVIPCCCFFGCGRSRFRWLAALLGGMIDVTFGTLNKSKLGASASSASVNVFPGV